MMICCLFFRYSREHAPFGARIVIDYQGRNDYVGHYYAHCYGDANEKTTRNRIIENIVI